MGMLSNRCQSSGLVAMLAIASHCAAPASAAPQLNPTPVQIAQAPLSGSWRLANMTAGGLPTPMVPPANTPLTAEFAGDRITGSGGCNQFMGSYKTTGDSLTIGALGATRKACPEPIMDQEMLFMNALQGAQRYEQDSQGLQIFYQTEQGSGVMRFVSQATTVPAPAPQPAPAPESPVRGLW
jgi:heat shock protein HslJ